MGIGDGYTAIQTSPVQIAKENTKNVSVGNWWVFYQRKAGAALVRRGFTWEAVKAATDRYLAEMEFEE